jgi:hypothetical protein
MNNFYSLLLLFSSPFFLRVLRVFAVRKKKPDRETQKNPIINTSKCRARLKLPDLCYSFNIARNDFPTYNL